MKKILILGVLLVCSPLLKSQNLEWVRNMGGPVFDNGNGIELDGAGNIYTTGEFSGKVDFDPGVDTFYIEAADGDIFISKLDPEGNFVWARGINYGTGYDLDIDASGNVYVTGNFYSTVDFDPGVDTFELISNGGRDVFLLKLDQDGNFIWANNFGGIGDEYAWDTEIDESNNIYLTGPFGDTVDFEPGPEIQTLVSHGLWDVYISKFDSDGNLLFAKTFGGSGFDCGASLTFKSDGNIVLAGTFEDTTDFDPGPEIYNLVAYNFTDIFLLELDNAGNFIWAKSITGTNAPNVYSIHLDTYNNIYICGSFEDTMDADPGPESFNLIANDYDIYIAKYDEDGNFIWANNIGGNQYDEARDISTDNENNVYVAGLFTDTIDFDPGPGVCEYNTGNNFNYELFLLKLNTDGAFLWAETVMGGGEVIPNAITQDETGNIYLTGEFYGNPDWDPSPEVLQLASHGSGDIFVLKIGTDSIDFDLVNNDVLNMDFTAGPNPAAGILYIHFSDNTFRIINIYDISGNLITQVQSSGSLITIDLSAIKCNPGIYFVKVSEPASGNTATKKIIIKSY